ncbi:MAG: hypothetical protein JF616_19890 [Fibrobacteres bacterium]|nr:hypothetical protein [Fibrobacterota bacterium]
MFQLLPSGLVLLLLVPLSGVATAQGAWTVQSTEFNDDFSKASFPDADHGWIIGANKANDSGVVVSTSDGGATWTRKPFGRPINIAAQQFVTAKIGWIAGKWDSTQSAGIFKTVDGGDHWVLQTPKDSTLWNANIYPGGPIFFLDSNTGWVGGGPNAMLKTTDGGVTWNTLGTGAGGIIFFLDADTGWMSNGITSIRKTVNGGTTWVTYPIGTANTQSSLFFADSKHGWITTYSSNTSDKGMVLASTDGGATWSVQNTGAAGTLYCVDFPSQDSGWAMGRFGNILRSGDGGTTWILQTKAVDKGLRSMAFIDAQTAWAVGDGGAILKFDADAVTGIRTRSLPGIHSEARMRRFDANGRLKVRGRSLGGGSPAPSPDLRAKTF